MQNLTTTTSTHAAYGDMCMRHIKRRTLVMVWRRDDNDGHADEFTHSLRRYGAFGANGCFHAGWP
jgi:hypothetical protein